MFDLYLILIKYHVLSGAVIGYDKGTKIEDSDIVHPVHVEHVFTSSKFNHREKYLEPICSNKDVTFNCCIS